jgi:PKD repeat protein
MKNSRPTRMLICLVFFVMAMACKKTNTITVQQPTACFTIQVKDLYSSFLQTGSATYIDSNFYFRNCSDSSEDITYLWDFGDGSTATDKHPVHHYGRRGKYTVTLEVSNNDQAFDTIRQTVTVMSGQQNIGFGAGNNAFPIAIQETTSGDFLLLGATDYNTGYFLMQLDSLLVQKNRKNLPASYRFASMKATGDGNYIFTGTTSGFTRDNELVKLGTDGTYIWNRISSSDDSYTNVYPAADGGYVVLAAQPVKDTYGNITYYTKVKKFDGTGSMQWQQSLYAEGMMQTKEAVLEPDGVIVAGVKRGTCMDCDSVMIEKLDNAGNPVWKNTVFGGLNGNLGSIRIIKQDNGNYVVGTEGARGIFIFSTAGAFLDRKLCPYSVTAVANSGDGNLVVLQTEWGNGFRAGVSKMRMDGSQLWYTTIDGRQKIPNGYMCCADSWPIALQPLRKGGTLVVARRVDRPADYSSYYYVMSLLQLDETGKPK